jgi:ribosomal protein S18 acetylase RimI-like enzyme
MRIRRPSPALAARQSEWIAGMEPWRSLGYRATGLARYLRRMARTDRALVAEVKGEVMGVVVCQPDFLLGSFVALLAVRPEAAGQGLGRALMARIEQTTLRKRRWLWVSSDNGNAAAAHFYRRLGFVRVARLPDLISEGHVEILWRKGGGRRGWGGRGGG